MTAETTPTVYDPRDDVSRLLVSADRNHVALCSGSTEAAYALLAAHNKTFPDQGPWSLWVPAEVASVAEPTPPTGVIHLVGDGGWNACDTAADWAGSDTTGVTCAECLETAGVHEAVTFTVRRVGDTDHSFGTFPTLDRARSAQRLYACRTVVWRNVHRYTVHTVARTEEIVP